MLNRRTIKATRMGRFLIIDVFFDVLLADGEDQFEQTDDEAPERLFGFFIHKI